MPRTLRDIKVIDLRKSKWDAEKSDPKKAKYHFTNRVPVTKEMMAAENVFFSWCQYNPQDGYRMLRDWESRLSYTPVKHGVDPFIAEGAYLNAEGYFQWGDLVLVRCPLDLELDRREHDIRIAMRSKDKLKSFAAGINMAEPGAGIDPDEMSDMLGVK